jgi:hypothetical protein
MKNVNGVHGDEAVARCAILSGHNLFCLQNVTGSLHVEQKSQDKALKYIEDLKVFQKEIGPTKPFAEMPGR